MGKIVKLKNANNENTYPVTKAEAVYMEDGQTTLKDYLDAMAITKTVGPAQTVTFDDGADNVPVKSLILNIQPHQEGTGDPSPTNIRPIVGYDNINIYHGNSIVKYEKNTFEQGGISTSGVTLPDTTTNHLKRIRSKNFEAISPGTYTALFYGDFLFSTRAYDAESESSANAEESITDNFYSIKTFTIINSRYFKFVIRNTEGTDFTPEDLEGSFIILMKNGSVYPITIPSAVGTVYGCTIDVPNGILTINRGIVDLGDLTYNIYTASGKDVFEVKKTQIATVTGKAPDSTNQKQLLCSCFPQGNGTVIDGTVYQTASSIRFVATDLYSDTTEFKTAMTGQKLVYYLDTPIVYSIQPQKVKTLLGENNFQIDTEGTIEITYIADLIAYINNKINN